MTTKNYFSRVGDRKKASFSFTMKEQRTVNSSYYLLSIFLLSILLLSFSSALSNNLNNQMCFAYRTQIVYNTGNITYINQTGGSDTFAGNYSTYLTLFNWNKTYADTLYAPIGAGSDNVSWNQSFASTLFYSISNPLNFINHTTNASYYLASNPLNYINSSYNLTYANFNKTFTDLFYAQTGTATCPAGQVAQNVTTSQVGVSTQCITPSSSTDTWQGNYTNYNTTVQLSTIFYPYSNPLNYRNDTTNSSYYLASNPNSFTTNESALAYVNSTGLIRNWTQTSNVFPPFNQTQMGNSTGVLSILDSWLRGVITGYGYLTTWLIPDSSGYLYNDSTYIYFNQTKLATTYYNVSTITFTTGSSPSPIGYIQSYNDIPYNVTEATGTPGLDMRINFTSVTSFNQFVIRYTTSSGVNNNLNVQIWDYATSTWEGYATLVPVNGYNVKTIGVYDMANHIDSGIIQMRFYVSQAGNTGEVWYVDWVTIANGFATPSGAEIDPLSIHTNAINTTQLFYNAILNVNETYLRGLSSATDTWASNYTLYNKTSELNNLFYSISNPLNFRNDTTNITYQNKAGTGTATCGAGTVAQNVTTTTTGVTSQCITPASATDTWAGNYTSYNTTAQLNTLYVAKAGDNVTGQINMTNHDIVGIRCFNFTTGGAWCGI